MESWTISRLQAWTTDYYQKNKIDSPRLEAEILLAQTLGLKRLEIYTKHEQVVEPEQLALFKERLKRRLKHEPLAYIINSQPFMSLDFYVDRSVLVPRPETELLVEKAIESCQTGTILDLGTGSGCIAVSLAKFLPNVRVIGIDSSSDAIAVAQKNAERHKVADRCRFMVGDMFDPLPDQIDLVVANPPYIPTAEIDQLQPEVRDWEPRQALDGGADGLDFIKKLLQMPISRLIFEFGFGQAPAIRQLVDNRFQEVRIIPDLNGIDRVFQGEKNG